VPPEITPTAAPGETAFDIEKYVRNSKKLDISDLDLTQVSRYPLSEDEVRCLTYMMDIEGHTIAYLKSILNTCAIRDPQTTAFLSCWVYEEFFHSYTLRQFLEAAGISIPENRVADVQRQASWRIWIEQIGSSLICQVSKHFHAVYLTWGAISELTTLEGYGVLAARTQNPLLAEILRRLAKDERRHFAFYYNKARLHLQPKNAQRLTEFILHKFWMPVGEGVKPNSEVEWIGHYILGDASGEAVAARIDHTIAKLPGMSWFRGLTATRETTIRNHSQEVPAILAPVAAMDSKT
jgi:Fatty acid desaturase